MVAVGWLVVTVSGSWRVLGVVDQHEGPAQLRVGGLWRSVGGDGEWQLVGGCWWWLISTRGPRTPGGWWRLVVGGSGGCGSHHVSRKITPCVSLRDVTSLPPCSKPDGRKRPTSVCSCCSYLTPRHRPRLPLTSSTAPTFDRIDRVKRTSL